MRLRHIASLVLAATVTLTSSLLLAQDGTKQDMKNAGSESKNAGSESKNAAKDTGRGIKTGTSKAYHKTAHGTKKAYHGTVHGTKKLGDKIAGKPTQ